MGEGSGKEAREYAAIMASGVRLQAQNAERRAQGRPNTIVKTPNLGVSL